MYKRETWRVSKRGSSGSGELGSRGLGPEVREAVRATVRRPDLGAGPRGAVAGGGRQGVPGSHGSPHACQDRGSRAARRAVGLPPLGTSPAGMRHPPPVWTDGCPGSALQLRVGPLGWQQPWHCPRTSRETPPRHAAGAGPGPQARPAAAPPAGDRLAAVMNVCSIPHPERLRRVKRNREARPARCPRGGFCRLLPLRVVRAQGSLAVSLTEEMTAPLSCGLVRINEAVGASVQPRGWHTGEP